jgi:hypothetical protein
MENKKCQNKIKVIKGSYSNRRVEYVKCGFQFTFRTIKCHKCKYGEEKNILPLLILMAVVVILFIIIFVVAI